MIQKPPPVAELLPRLAAFGPQLAALLARSVAWRRRPAGGEWSLVETVCHLRDVELEVHQPRFRRLIAQADAFIAGVNPDDWTAQRDYQQEDGPAALAAFVKARAETVLLLSPLDEAMWTRQAQHAFLGQTTMHELLYLIISHDEAHWPQLTTLAA